MYKSLAAGAVLLTATFASAQSLGDVARQERSRRAAAPPASARVLTNEDLQREKILRPRAVQPAMPQNAAASEELLEIPAVPLSEKVVPLWTAAPGVNQPASPEPSQITLGEFARQVRAERAARRRVREIIAQREQKIPVVVIAPVPSAPAQEPKRAPAVAVFPQRRVVRPVTRRYRQRRAAPRVANVAVPVSGETLLVNRGDSLWKIAQREFGDGRMWTVLWQANPQLADPNLIYAGQSLRRPAAEQIAQQRASRAASALLASQKKQNSSDSFAAQVLARESRKASLRSSETLPSLLPAPLLDGARSSGPPRSPR